MGERARRHLAHTHTLSGQGPAGNLLSPWPRTAGSDFEEGRALDGLIPPVRFANRETEAWGGQSSSQSQAA